MTRPEVMLHVPSRPRLISRKEVRHQHLRPACKVYNVGSQTDRTVPSESTHEEYSQIHHRAVDGIEFRICHQANVGRCGAKFIGSQGPNAVADIQHSNLS